MPFAVAETATSFYREWSEKPAVLIPAKSRSSLILSMTCFLPIDRAKRGEIMSGELAAGGGIREFGNSAHDFNQNCTSLHVC